MFTLKGIQEYLNENGRTVNLFGDPAFTSLSRALNEILANFQPRISPEGLLICRIEEEHLWEAKQLGSQSAEVGSNVFKRFLKNISIPRFMCT